MFDTLLVTLGEAARQLGIAEKTARNWLSEDRFPVETVRIGSRRMVRVTDLETFVLGLGNSPQQPPQKPISDQIIIVSKRLPGRPRKQTAEAWGSGYARK